MCVYPRGYTNQQSRLRIRPGTGADHPMCLNSRLNTYNQCYYCYCTPGGTLLDTVGYVKKTDSKALLNTYNKDYNKCYCTPGGTPLDTVGYCTPGGTLLDTVGYCTPEVTQLDTGGYNQDYNQCYCTPGGTPLDTRGYVKKPVIRHY